MKLIVVMNHFFYKLCESSPSRQKPQNHTLQEVFEVTKEVKRKQVRK